VKRLFWSDALGPARNTISDSVTYKIFFKDASSNAPLGNVAGYSPSQSVGGSHLGTNRDSSFAFTGRDAINWFGLGSGRWNRTIKWSVVARNAFGKETRSDDAELAVSLNKAPENIKLNPIVNFRHDGTPGSRIVTTASWTTTVNGVLPDSNRDNVSYRIAFEVAAAYPTGNTAIGTSVVKTTTATGINLTSDDVVTLLGGVASRNDSVRIRWWVVADDHLEGPFDSDLRAAPQNHVIPYANDPTSRQDYVTRSTDGFFTISRSGTVGGVLASFLLNPAVTAADEHRRAGDSVLVSITAVDSTGNLIPSFDATANPVSTTLTLLNSNANMMNDPTMTWNNWQATIRHKGTGTVLYGLGVSEVNATQLFKNGVLEVWVTNTKAEAGVHLQATARTSSVVTGTSAKMSWRSGYIFTVSINSDKPNLLTTASSGRDTMFVGCQFPFKLRMFDRYGNRNLTDTMWFHAHVKTGFATHLECPGLAACLDPVAFTPNSHPDSARAYVIVSAPPGRRDDIFQVSNSARNYSTPFSTPLDSMISKSLLTTRNFDVLQLLPPTSFTLSGPNSPVHLSDSGKIMLSWTAATSPNPKDTVKYEVNFGGIRKDVGTALTATLTANELTAGLGLSPTNWTKTVSWSVTARSSIACVDFYNNSSYPSTTVNGVPISIIREFVTSVEKVSDEIPKSFALEQNYPNPFNPSTTIEFSLPRSDYVTLKIYDVLGREVATLVNEWKEAGIYSITFDTRNSSFDILSSGVYYYRLQTSQFVEIKKLVLLR
jgi:hypothetical protein